jgi:hypothetical protein
MAVAMDERTDIALVTERYERRLSEECGKLRVETAGVRVEIASGFAAHAAQTAALRAEMIERNGELLKWILVFNATMVAAFAALLVLLR